MAMTSCKECSKEVSSTAMTCPHCGHKLRMGWFGKTLLWAGGLFGGFLLFGALQPSDPAKASARSAIELCWDQQSRKSIDPGTARYAAGLCEQMESDFRRKYGVNP